MDSPRTSREWKDYLFDKDPLIWRKFIESAGDEIVYFDTQAFRRQTETLLDWQMTKEKALKEILEIPDNILELLIEKLHPFIRQLPAGHGRGHMHRDIIGITALLHDPQLQNIDEAEILAGILGGVFHDIGNSVVDRYLENQNYSGHAEVGSYLFGVKAEQLIPPNLLLLIRFVIAAHTNYLKNLTISKNNRVLTRLVYDDSIIDGNKTAVLLARQSDRSDIIGITGIIRHSLTKVRPTQGFSDDGFQYTFQDDFADFKHQFTPVIRTREYRDSLKNPQEKSTNILEHLLWFAETNTGKSPYSKSDSVFVKDMIMNKSALQEYIFIARDISLMQEINPRARDQIFERFFIICKQFEPAKDIDAIINTFRKKLKSLPGDYQNHWANAFELLSTRLLKEWYSGKKKLITKPPLFKNQKIQKIARHLHSLANTYLEEFNPRLLGA